MSIDKQITPGPEYLRTLGIRDARQALKNLELLSGKLGPESFSSLAPSLFSHLALTADPDMALNNLERFADALVDARSFVLTCAERTEVVSALMTIFGASRFLSTFLVTLADEGLTLVADPGCLTSPAGKHILFGALTAETKDHVDEKSFYRAMRVFRKKAMLRIGLRDLLGRANLRETTEELSDLAEVCLQRAYEWADTGLAKRFGRPVIEQVDGTRAPAGFAVIAMGKLGGRELNFSSDVDLMYVYAADGETEGVSSPDGGATNRITNHQYFIKLAEKLSAALNEKTDDGFVFRVDLRLRPEGQRGPLAQSLGGYEIYYESWGQTWERSALVKARPVAGDPAVGAEFLERVTPFVYRKYLDYGAIVEIRDMKQKINKDVEQKGRTHRDVKLGYGGIREIEFVIQALQLIYGGRDRALRERNAQKALHTLSQKGLITYEEQAALSSAYVFLRAVEHRIQILDDLQTQTLPSDDDGLRALARRSGYLERGREAELLLHDYAEHTGKVRRIYDDLFAFTGEEPAAEATAGDHGRLFDADMSEQEAVSLLASRGFRDPGKAYRNLLLLREGPAFVHQTPRGRRLFQEIIPPLFGELISSPDPDMALNHLEAFLAAQGSWEVFQSLVKLDASAVKVLVAIFANSEYLSRMLISRPAFLQDLIESVKVQAAGTCSKFSKELAQTLERSADLPDKLDALRRFKHQEELRIGMGDLLAGVRLTTASRDLSKLAEVCLEAALNLAISETAKRYNGIGAASGLAVIGLGKLGGRELTYGSDLDILFVYSEPRAAAPPPGLSVFEFFSKAAEKTISYLSTLTREGFVFRVDARLRPTGSKGPLAQSMDAFRSYYAAQAETWELQALLRARFVAGDRAVGVEFSAALQNLLYREQDPRALARDVLSMRMRMEAEVGRESAAFYNIKQGAGGIVDIEFLVQYLQLRHGREHRRVRIPGTYNALRALKKEGILDEDACRTLLEAYLFLRRLESRMRIVTNQTSSMLGRDAASLSQLARRMGYADEGSATGEKLLADYELHSHRVRSLFVLTVLP